MSAGAQALPKSLTAETQRHVSFHEGAYSYSRMVYATGMNRRRRRPGFPSRGAGTGATVTAYQRYQASTARPLTPQPSSPEPQGAGVDEVR